ncbi:MAG: hypothetical protein IPO91_12700 [Chloroflexi bacterium]|nr:hypothetical protein [Chloroflexota bacterium]
MRMLIRILMIIISVIVVLLVGGWLGLQIKASAFPTVAVGAAPSMIPIPEGLPAPVDRFARAVFGDSLPDVQSALVLGRAQLAPTGLPMPTRFRFYYDAARSSHYHDIQVTWFNLTFMRIHERNLEGHTQLDLAVIGQVNDQPKTNRAAIQGYWSEVLAWVPSIALTDPRVRWEAVDDTIVRLYLPGLDDAEAFTVRFAADTGLISQIETMRYQNEDNAERWHWFNRILEWGTVDGLRVPVRAQTQWRADSPWATWEIEQIALNVDVAPRLAQFGGDVPG